MKWRLSTICCGSVFLALALSPAAVADPSWAKVSVGIDVTASLNIGGLTAVPHPSGWGIWPSGSTAMALYANMANGMPVWPFLGHVTDSQYGTVTTASAALPPQASAYGETAWLHTYAKAEITPTAGKGGSTHGTASQWYGFTALAQGKVTFEVSRNFTIDFATAVPGEWAGNGGYKAEIVLFDGSGSSYWAFTVRDGRTVADGDSYYDTATQTLTASSPTEFAAGQPGWLLIHCDASAEAVSIVGPIDSDGDGINDSDDAFPNDPTEWADSDGDGVGDNADICPNSNVDPTVIVAGHITDVENVLNWDGQGSSLNDAMAVIDSGEYRNHGEYVSTVAQFAENLVSAGVITDDDKDTIVSCAARSDIGREDKPDKEQQSGKRK